MWEAELQKTDVKVWPSNIAGIWKLADVEELLGCLTPFMLTNEDYLAFKSGTEPPDVLEREEREGAYGFA